MLRILTAKQFRELYLYEQLDPSAEWRADYRAASVVQVIANVNRAKGQKALSLEDVVLRFEESERKQQSQTWQEKLAIAKMVAAAFNAPGGINT